MVFDLSLSLFERSGGNMKNKKLLTGLLIGALAVSTLFVSGCNKNGSENEGTSQTYIDLNVRPGDDGSELQPTQTDVKPEATVVDEDNEYPAGLSEADCYRSELTNMWIDKKLQNQRPIAVMVDNELTALDHYGVNQADIVYECMNSTANGRVTRLMCIVKDWAKLEQFGSIRSTRPTNVILAGEYNAILVHDGGPFYINPYLAKAYSNNLSGGFTRFKNGKSYEFTEYVTSDVLTQKIKAAGYTTEYNNNYAGAHFQFNDMTTELDGHYGNADGTDIYLPYPHNKSELHYNEKTREYEYKEYGKAHVDPLDGNKVLSFDNVILQNTGWNLCKYNDGTPDPNGYMIYDVVNEGSGYYFTKGRCIGIRWKKTSETAITKYFDKETGEELKLNTGKTYITLVPNDKWAELKFN